jgi:hypothetical protein
VRTIGAPILTFLVGVVGAATVGAAVLPGREDLAADEDMATGCWWVFTKAGGGRFGKSPRYASKRGKVKSNQSMIFL